MQQQAETYLTKPEIAKFVRVSIRKVDLMREHDGMPFIKLGDRVVFDRAAVEAWMKARAKQG